MVSPQKNIELCYMQVLFVDRRVPDFQVFVDSVNEKTIPIAYVEPTFPQGTEQGTTEGTMNRVGFVFIMGSLQWFDPEHEDTMVQWIQDHGIQHIDFFACNTLLNPTWKTYYERLTERTGVIVGASDNQTGNLKYGGDWIMESTLEDIEQVYFTQSIEYYKYLLDE